MGLAGTANISVFNLVNTPGGIIGRLTVDNPSGSADIPVAAIVIPIIGIASVFFSRGKAVLI